ncbi:MAG: aldo/keto reductase [Candidatus Sumerlaeota bacterium]|nr:aldo/keto reductase [Candidatus Sumerlaeota bacterium]
MGGLFIGLPKATPRDEAVRVIHRALELGVNYLDTAPLYGNSQQILGEALEGRKGPYWLGSKCGRWDWRTGPYRNLDAFKKQFAQTLKDLRRTYVDILYIHEADWAVYWIDQELPRQTNHISPDGVYDYASAPVAKFVMWAKEQGLAKHLGIAGNNAHLLAKVLREIELPIEVVLVAYQYSLIWRNAREFLLPAAKEKGAGVVLGAPLQQGRLAVPNRQWLQKLPEWMDEDTRGRYERLYAIHDETGLSLADLAVRFLLADKDFSTVIPGPTTVGQLEENIRSAAAGPLPPELHARLDALGRVFAGVHGVDY